MFLVPQLRSQYFYMEVGGPFGYGPFPVHHVHKHHAGVFAALLLLCGSSFSENSKEGISKKIYLPHEGKNQSSDISGADEETVLNVHAMIVALEGSSEADFWGLQDRVSISLQKGSLFPSCKYCSDMFAVLKIKCWYYSNINRRLLCNVLSSKISLLQDHF